jgi:hypothetical protein
MSFGIYNSSICHNSCNITVDVAYRSSRLELENVSLETRGQVETLEEATVRKLDLVTGATTFMIC